MSDFNLRAVILSAYLSRFSHCPSLKVLGSIVSTLRLESECESSREVTAPKKERRLWAEDVRGIGRFVLLASSCHKAWV